MTTGENPRLHFDIRLIFGNNEAKFEAKINSEFGKNAPTYRSGDDFLVANIYDDRQSFEVGDLNIYRYGELTSAEVDGVITAEVEGVTTVKVDGVTAADVDNVNISEISDIPIIEVSDLIIDTSTENMSDTTIVRKKSKNRLSYYFNKFLGET
ncbi:hypothetical protein BDF21DRAFT_410895 [Thamnidium elegans]|nr:hypothetical protein BDF21DRAFT_410895 [Thamnidium elegans]